MGSSRQNRKMKRARTFPGTPKPAAAMVDPDDENDEENAEEEDLQMLFLPDDRRADLTSKIASFLTLSDAAAVAASIGTYPGNSNDDNDGDDREDDDSWAVGSGAGGDESWTSLDTPITPALVALSPGATPHSSAVMTTSNYMENEEEDDSEIFQQMLRQKRRKWAQEKITNAVFAHPGSLRSYCCEAYLAAKAIKDQKEQQLQQLSHGTPETRIEPDMKHAKFLSRKKSPRSGVAKKFSNTALHAKLAHDIVDFVFHNVPVSVLLDVLEAMGITAAKTVGASFTISISSLQNLLYCLGRLAHSVWDAVAYCVTNPFQLLETIVSLQFNAMGKTSEVIVGGIHSVASGVGSASSLALHKMTASHSNISLSSRLLQSEENVAAVESRRRTSRRLLKKLSDINDAALVVDYREIGDYDTAGLTRQAVCRARRMMHYSVSLRPFVATVQVASPIQQGESPPAIESNAYRESTSNVSLFEIHMAASEVKGSSSSEDDESPFMCTPQSFPPTPHSRQIVIDQRSLMSDEVVFLVRDRLRVHDALDSDDARTRERAQDLEKEKRLAIFAHNKHGGIELTCGSHIATKTGNMCYASTRSMVSILRNCFVYFEMTVIPRVVEPAVTSLSIGLSTEEMPPNTLVGAWQGSVGLCSTGQILLAGQWCSPADPLSCTYGTGATVGCLVYLDDEPTVETWDGVMIKATTRFNVNGRMVAPPESTFPMAGAPAPIQSPTMPVGMPHSQEAEPTGLVGLESPFARVGTPLATVGLLVPETAELYPTVTLQSLATSVVCRFSSEDVLASNREVIGAPPGVAVYAVDGSVILQSDAN